MAIYTQTKRRFMRRAWILSRAFTQTKRRYDEAGLDPIQSLYSKQETL